MTINLNVNSNVSVVISEPNDILELMSGEDKIQLIESLSCHDEVIEHVLNQITRLHGATENGNSGGSSGVGGSCALDKARAKIAESASELARDTIASLSSSLENKEARINELTDKLNNR